MDMEIWRMNSDSGVILSKLRRKWLGLKTQIAYASFSPPCRLQNIIWGKLYAAFVKLFLIQFHRLLKAKLARYRAQLLEPTGKSGPAGAGFDVQKSGASVAASYEFTTLTAIPGVLEYSGARIQLLDLPGIVEGASQGRGRGRQVVAVAKTADLIIMMLDATKSQEQRRLLEIELDAVGIRLNKQRPDIVFKQRTTGGMTINTTVKLTKTDEKTIRTVLAGFPPGSDKIHNCDVMIREITIDEFIDVLIGTRKYTPCLYVYNKVDSISLEQVDKLAREDHTIVISCELGLNLDGLLDRIWEDLGLVKVYTKKRGEHPDLSDPICLRKGATITDIDCLIDNFFRVGLNHIVQDEDVVSICSFYEINTLSSCAIIKR
ncbi:hypothetical protein Clacol_003038 [Clathrus columnatus]|uniref:OBG-type G domain-containing protein n=1 Tax=Clathrus columnatus TaxID=1419009 RepID=A0AAV5A2E3_9AGAM|nr:hypothetical protein Clacol_003038 [Clathrus columnatus]